MSRRQLERLQTARRGEKHPWAGWNTAKFATAIANHPVRGHLQGLRIRPQLMNSLDRHIDALRRMTHGTGPVYIGTLERVILEAGRDDRGNRDANLAHGLTTLYRVLRLLEAIGAVRWGHYERQDAGNGGVWIELLTPVDVASSVSLQACAGQRHRRQTRKQRQEGRHAPRKRRYSAPARRDFDWPRAISFTPKLVTPYGASPGSPPTGASPGEPESKQAVRRRVGRDAIERPDSATAVATPGGAVNSSRGERTAALVSAARRGDPPVSLVLAAWRLLWPDRRPRLSEYRRTQLERDVGTFDRIEGEIGAAVCWVFRLMVEHRQSGDPPPLSVGLFISELRRATGERRETWRLAREADGRHYRRAGRRGAARKQRRAERLTREDAELAARDVETPWLT